MKLMRVKALSPDAQTQQATVVLEDLTERLALGFLVPMNEADRLARALGLTSCPCVPVFELIEQLLSHFGARALRVVLDGNDVGIASTLSVGEHGGETAFSCHPADALALAKRANAPIYATEGALRHACPLDSHHQTAGDGDVRCWLENVRPEDFEG